MQITNNLNRDIIEAPDWFHKAIQDKPEDKILADPLGNVSYSKWVSKNTNQNLIILIHGTLRPVLFLQLDLRTLRSDEPDRQGRC